MSQKTELRSEFFSPPPPTRPTFPHSLQNSGIAFCFRACLHARNHPTDQERHPLLAASIQGQVHSGQWGSGPPAVDSIVSECPHLKTKLLVSQHCWDGWLNFQELLQWICEVGGPRHCTNHSSISESAYPVTQLMSDLSWSECLPLCASPACNARKGQKRAFDLLELQIIVSCPVGVRNWTWVLCNNRCS